MITAHRPSLPFLSTPSARRATRVAGAVIVCTPISIHALREEGDCWCVGSSAGRCNFYPRPPRGGRHSLIAGPPVEVVYFYPRPPRGGRLHNGRPRVDLDRYFYPRPPRGGRPAAAQVVQRGERFLSTPSARRATCPPENWVDAQLYFYPRPPRGGRPTVCQKWRPTTAFLSTPSARRATCFLACIVDAGKISIHALREEGDRRPMFRLYP